MVKTSDFESENSGSSPGEAATVTDLQRALLAHSELLKKAFVITGGPPLQMRCDEEEFAQIAIVGDQAVLSWPEIDGGYYAGDSTMQRQTCTFPAFMLTRPMSEIIEWKADEQKKYDEKQRADRLARQKQEEARQRELELRALAVLTAKYGKPA